MLPAKLSPMRDVAFVRARLPFEPMRRLLPEADKFSSADAEEPTSTPSTYCFIVVVEPSPCTTATWCQRPSQTLALMGPGTEGTPEPSTLKLSLAVDEAQAGSPHSKTEACGVETKGRHRTKALRLMDALPVGSDAGIDADVSRCAP